MFKIFGVIMIIFSTTYIGFLKASTYKNRILELTEFQKGFELFETEVRFTKSPLCTAFLNISKNLSGNVSLIFKQFSEEYLDTNGESANEIWDKVIDNNIKNLNLVSNDLSIIKDFGICLGTFDEEGQLESVSSIIKRLSSHQDSVTVLCEKNSKLYQSLGVYSGILVSVLLF